MPNTDIELARRAPVQVVRPAAPRKRSPGDPNAAHVLTVALVLIAIAGLFGGFLAAISGDLL